MKIQHYRIGGINTVQEILQMSLIVLMHVAYTAVEPTAYNCRSRFVVAKA